MAKSKDEKGQVNYTEANKASIGDHVEYSMNGKVYDAKVIDRNPNKHGNQLLLQVKVAPGAKVTKAIKI